MRGSVVVSTYNRRKLLARKFAASQMQGLQVKTT